MTASKLPWESKSSAFRARLADASDAAETLFMSSTAEKTRAEYFARGKLGDQGKGAVYVYSDKKGVALYVGQTSRQVKRRMHDQLAAHKLSIWWNDWDSMRFLPLANEADRFVLEALLIVSMKPRFNRRPSAESVSSLFASL